MPKSNSHYIYLCPYAGTYVPWTEPDSLGLWFYSSYRISSTGTWHPSNSKVVFYLSWHHLGCRIHIPREHNLLSLNWTYNCWYIYCEMVFFHVTLVLFWKWLSLLLFHIHSNIISMGFFLLASNKLWEIEHNIFLSIWNWKLI